MRATTSFLLLLFAVPAAAWSPTPRMSSPSFDRRSLLKIPAAFSVGLALPSLRPDAANAVVYFDPGAVVLRVFCSSCALACGLFPLSPLLAPFLLTPYHPLTNAESCHRVELGLVVALLQLLSSSCLRV